MPALDQPATERVVEVAVGPRAYAFMLAAARASPRRNATEIGIPAHGQARLLRDAGARQGGERAGHQVGLPPARQGLPSRPQCRRQGRRAQVQGAERGLRGPEGSAEARRLRPVRPRRLRWHGGRGGARLRAGLRLLDVRHLRRPVRRVHGRPARRRPPRSARERGADLRYNMEITLPEAFAGKTAQIRVPTSVTCETCTGIGRQARHQALDLPDLRRRRQGARQPGLLHHRAHLPVLPGARRDHQRPVRRLQRLGPRHARSARCRSTSRPASRTARASASPAKARPACAAGRPATSTSSCRSSRTSSSSATAPTSSAACRSP